jgi:hypothetical protein
MATARLKSPTRQSRYGDGASEAFFFAEQK